MSVMQRLDQTYDCSGVLIHFPLKATFGDLQFGEITSKAWHSPSVGREPCVTATGMELARSIEIVKKRIALCNQAIENMQRILDTAEPITGS
jgi:hypothetical protein